MAKDIKQRIVLEGEKEYNQALKDANRNLKTLQSALKAETAELGKNATEQQKNEAKVKSLKKQIAEQEKIVATYKAALAEVKEKYADNEDAIAKWEQRLNNARTTLANMQQGIEDVGGSMQAMEADAAATVVATKSVADALGQIGGVGDTVAGAIEGIFTGMLDIVKDACSEVWALISETAARADNFVDVAGYWNSDAQEIQRWANAVEGANDSFEDLQYAVSKLSMGDEEKIRKLTGISYVGDADQWEYAMQVLGNLAQMDYGKKMASLEELFGEKKATKIIDLLNDWDKITAKYKEWNGDESGYGMTSEGLETMAELYSQIGEINKEWQMLKDRVAEGLGVAAMSLLINVDGAMDGVAEFLNAKSPEEREEALQKIRTNLEEFFRKLGETIRECLGILNEVGQELQGSDDPVTRAIGDILTGLTEALQWMIDNQDAVKAAFWTIFGVWLLAQLAAVSGKLSGILMQIKAIQAFKGLSRANTAAKAAEAGAESGLTGGAAGGGLFASIRALAGKAAAGAANIGSYVGNSAGPYMDWFLHNTDAGRWIRGEETFEDVKRALGGYVESVQHNAETFQEDWANNPIIQFLREGYETNGRNATALWDAITGKKVPVAEVEEDELLDDDTGLVLSPADRESVENFWDALMGVGGPTAVEEAYEDMLTHFGGSESDLAVMDKIISLIDSLKEIGYTDADLPSWWFSDSWPGAGGESGENGISSSDLQGFRGLPGQIQAAAQRGTAAGISGIKVYMDGVAVGHLVAPTVSRDIGAAIL